MKLKTIIIMSILFLSVFLIYLVTIDKKVYYLNIGDNLTFDNNYSNQIENYLKNKNKLEKGVHFTNFDYRVTDLIRDINDNKSKVIDGKRQTIKNALIKADLVTISIGKNDIYYKISNSEVDEIYNYVDEVLADTKELLTILKEYCKEDIILIGIIDYNTKYPEVIDYINSKLKNMSKQFDIEFTDIDNKLDSKSINNNVLTQKGINKLVHQIVKIIENKTLK